MLRPIIKKIKMNSWFIPSVFVYWWAVIFGLRTQLKVPSCYFDTDHLGKLAVSRGKIEKNHHCANVPFITAQISFIIAQISSLHVKTLPRPKTNLLPFPYLPTILSE